MELPLEGGRPSSGTPCTLCVLLSDPSSQPLPLSLKLSPHLSASPAFPPLIDAILASSALGHPRAFAHTVPSV